MLPEYRKAIGDKLIDSLEDLEHYGCRWEKQRDLDSRYASPLLAEKMHVPGAAYSGNVVKPKVAAVEAEEKYAAKAAETSNKEKKTNAKKATASSTSSESEKAASASVRVSNGKKQQLTAKNTPQPSAGSGQGSSGA